MNCSDCASSKFFGESWDTVNRNMTRYKLGLDEETAGAPQGEDFNNMEILKNKVTMMQKVCTQWRANGLCLKTVLAFRGAGRAHFHGPCLPFSLSTGGLQHNKNKHNHYISFAQPHILCSV